MDELLKELTLSGGLTDLSTITLRDFLLATFCSFLFSTIMSIVYRKTYSGLSYSRNFSLTIVLMSVTVSFIMLIIGSNLARAFSLVGALSIIRFRNAVKESKDTAYIFVTMAIGMACGTKFYLLAAFFCFISTLIILLFDKIDFGTTNSLERILQVQGPENNINSSVIEPLIKKLSNDKYLLLSSEKKDGQKILTYNVELNRNDLKMGSIESISDQVDGVEVKVFAGFDRFEL